MYNKVRNLFLALACLLLLSSAVQAATIIVDNNPAHAADYRTLQEAVDGATAGDTILVGPSFSGTSYGNAYVTKQLKIYGTGYLLDENGYYTGAGESKVDMIYLANGDDQDKNCVSSSSGSIIAGLKVMSSFSVAKQGVPNNAQTCPNLSNIVITRNYTVQDIIASSVTGIVISNNIVRSISLDFSTGILRNNIISGQVMCMYTEMLMVNNSTTSAHRFGNSYSSTYEAPCSGEAYNNIAVGITNYGTEASVNIHDNYLTSSFSDVYTYTGSADAQYQLKTTSPAKGACLNGADCGAFAGATPYILSGLPPRPRITNLEVPATVFGTSTTMPVKVSAEGRN